MVKEGNSMISKGNKLVEIGKATLGRFVCSREGIEATNEPLDVIKSTFALESIFIITAVAIVEVGKQNKFNEPAFAAHDTETYLAFKRDVPTVRVKSLV